MKYYPAFLRKLQMKGRTITLIYDELKQLRFDQRKYLLEQNILNSTSSGISKEQYCNHEIIVSLTTHGKRLYEVHLAIESIMEQTMKANRIVLWLDYSFEKQPLPKVLQLLQKRGLEIEYCKDIRSYTKLIPALKKFPNDVIITIDDDMIYHYDIVEKLVNAHNLFPKDIIANRVHRMVLDKDGRSVSYMKWDWNVNPTLEEDSQLLFLTGVGGVLYPPHSLHPEVMNEAVFMDICKFADDVWFDAMALMAGTKIRKCYTHNSNGDDFVCNQDVQDIGLRNINTGKDCANDRQLKAVFDKFELWDKLK